LSDKIRTCRWLVGCVTRRCFFLCKEMQRDATGCNLCRGRVLSPSHVELGCGRRGRAASSDPGLIPCQLKLLVPTTPRSCEQRTGLAQTAISWRFCSSSSIDAAIYNTRAALSGCFYFYVPTIGGLACKRWPESLRSPIPKTRSDAPCAEELVRLRRPAGNPEECASRQRRFGLMAEEDIKMGP